MLPREVTAVPFTRRIQNCFRFPLNSLKVPARGQKVSRSNLFLFFSPLSRPPSASLLINSNKSKFSRPRVSAPTALQARGPIPIGQSNRHPFYPLKQSTQPHTSTAFYSSPPSLRLNPRLNPERATKGSRPCQQPTQSILTSGSALLADNQRDYHITPLSTPPPEIRPKTMTLCQ